MMICGRLRLCGESTVRFTKTGKRGEAKLGRNSGFTLVEVVVILTILAVLAAIAVPRLTGYLDKANEAEIKQNLATCVKAVQTWASERYADGVIGQDALVYPDASAGAPAGSSLPVNPGTYETDSPTSATTWLGIVREYAGLDLDVTIWYITEVNFDDYNALTHLVLNRSDDGQAAVYEAEGRYADGGGYIGMPGGNPSTPGGGGGQSGTGGTPAKVYYTVVFDSQGGSAVIPQRVLPGNNVVRPGNPIKRGYRFEGWCLDAEGNSPYDFSSPVRREKLTLYAKWTDKGEYFEFTIDTRLGDGQNTFSIGVDGGLSSYWYGIEYAYDYDWDVYVDDGEAVQYTRADAVAYQINIDAQLAKDGAEVGIHTIIIAEHGKTTGENSFGWFRAFGGEWGDEDNRRKLATLVSPLPTIGLCESKNGDGTYNAGNSFAVFMFTRCDGPSFAMGKDFNLPQDIATVGYEFCRNMFSDCNGSAFTMNEIFNLPQGITSVGDEFAQFMFGGLRGEAFTMNEVFNLPQGITTVGTFFCRGMFYYCDGSSFTMNEVFNLPPGITAAKFYFCEIMFNSCSGENFTMNGVFNLPQGITSVEESFADAMFGTCYGRNFMVSDVFKFPEGLRNKPDEVNKEGVFRQTFSNISSKTQSVTAASIINGLPDPSVRKHTFERMTWNDDPSAWSDYDSLPDNWK